MKGVLCSKLILNCSIFIFFLIMQTPRLDPDFVLFTSRVQRLNPWLKTLQPEAFFSESSDFCSVQNSIYFNLVLISQSPMFSNYQNDWCKIQNAPCDKWLECVYVKSNTKWHPFVVPSLIKAALHLHLGKLTYLCSHCFGRLVKVFMSAHHLNLSGPRLKERLHNLKLLSIFT